MTVLVSFLAGILAQSCVLYCHEIPRKLVIVPAIVFLSLYDPHMKEDVDINTLVILMICNTHAIMKLTLLHQIVYEATRMRINHILFN